MNFDRLINPVDSSRFFSELWQRAPLFVERDSPGYYDGAVGISDVDGWLLHGRVRYPELKLMKNGTPLPAETMLQSGWLGGVFPGDERPARVAAVHDAYRSGYTVVLRVEKLSPAVAALCRSLEEALHHSSIAELFLTPKESQGFGLHADEHDVFVMQLSGTKRWKVYQPPERRSPKPLEEQVGEPLVDVVVHPGDLLYVPLGFPHQASTMDQQSSLHLSLGVFTFKWSDLVTQALQAVTEEVPEFRAPLPVELLRKDASAFQETLKALIGTLLEKADARVGHERLALNYCNSLRPLADGHFSDVDALSSITLDTELEQRPGSISYLAHQRESLVLAFPGNRLKLPLAAAEPLDYIVITKEPFTARSLPGNLDEKGRLALVTALVSGGLLHVRGGAGYDS